MWYNRFCILGGCIVSKKSNHNDIKSIWKSGKIQRVSRITYDVIWNIILFFLVIGFIGIFFAGGIGAGYFASLVKDEPIRPASSMEKDIYNYEETSKYYFANNVYLGDVRSDLHREETSLDKISDLILDAVVAAEDESVYEHKGVVPQAITRAILQEALNADVKTGGSTLTQQLIKNQVLTNEVSFDRKAKEILLALRLENFFEKDQILEAYLNIIPYGREASGRNIAGVQTAAKGIFGVNADEVNLPQAAYLAGLPQSPSAYTPFISAGGLKDDEGLKPGLNRMKTVLKRMYDANFINQEQYEEALAYNIVDDFVKKASSPTDRYAYVVYELEKRSKEIIKEVLAQEDGYSLDDLKEDEELDQQYDILAERSLRMDGYHIHSTIDKKIYDAMQKVVKDYPHFGPDRTVIDKETGEDKIDQVQVGGELVENGTVRIISFVGGRGYTEENQVNHATNAYRSNGSTMKPLLVYAPALELGSLQPGSPISDHINTFGGWTLSHYSSSRRYGIVSAREALAKSYNIHAAAAYMDIINQQPAHEFLGKMSFDKLAQDFDNLALSIGSTTDGITVEENNNAFAALGNNGTYVDSYMIEKITTSDGEVVYEHEPSTVEIFSPQTAYLTIDMMRDVIRYGTAPYVSTQLNNRSVDWAGKTGTSGDHHDAWFAATNPNVTFSTWIGYDTPYDLSKCSSCSLSSYSHRNLKIWAELINAAAEVNPELVTPTERFKRPDGIVERSYCAISGMLPSELCKKAGLVYSDLFNAKFVPTKVDDSLISGSYTMVDGKSVVAGPNTPPEFVNGDGLAFNPEFLKRNGYDKVSDISQLYPRTNRHLWEKIAAPSGELGETITDDGKEPSQPTNLKASGNQLTWEKSSSKDVVGYRIYFAPSPDDDFKLIGNTTDTNVKFTGDKAVFHVRAVDYFGLESTPSKEIIVGQFDEPEKDEDEDKGEEKKNHNKPKKEPEAESNHNNSNDTDSNNEND